MSRRRKHADSPARRSTPRRAAAENCCLAVEPGAGSPRAAGDSRLCRARARSLRREQRRAAADGEPGPGEEYKTPTRVVKVDLLSSAFSSPNDLDGQTDIFWDQNSPMTKQLGKGRKKKISSTCGDEISHIVNRIAPQVEKPVTNSMLGVWIGETAIPCTPSVAKEKSRAKISCAKLKSQNREKELMKLAEQFDRNMGELDVIQEQDGRGPHFMQTASEVGRAYSRTDCTRMESGDAVPEVSCALIKKQVEGHAGISEPEEQDSSETPFDQSVEADLNAIFDGSTQMCSGQLSQDLSGAILNNSRTTFVKKISFIEEEVSFTTETLLTENLLNKTPVSPSPQVNTATMLKSCVTPYAKTPETSSKRLDELTTCDFEDDWENLLGSEPFLMENADMLEHTPSASAQGTAQKAICTFIGKNDAVTSRANMNLDRRLRDSKITLGLPSETRKRELRSTRENRFSPYPGDESRKLPFTENRVKSEKSVSNISKNEDVAASNLTGVKEDGRGKCTFLVDASDKPDSYTRYPNKQKYGLSAKLPLKAPADAYRFDPVFLGKENSVCNTDQTHGSKSTSSLDDWNDPLLASEMVEACHQLETTWAAGDVDDDLLYQACDDVERLTQQENRGSEESASLKNIPTHGSRNAPTASTQGSLLVVPSKHWNPVSSSTPSSLTNKSQMNKSVMVRKRDSCPTILDATTNVSMCSKNSSGNQHVPLVQVNSPKFVLAGSSSLNVSLGPVRTGIATDVKLSMHPLSYSALANRTQNDSGVLKCSKFTFKTKNPHALSQLNQNCIARSIPVSKILQDLGKEETVHSLLEGNPQRPSIKSSESLKPSSTDEEERNRKYSPEEIQRKRQEALVRRKAKAQAWPTVHPAPISLL